MKNGFDRKKLGALIAFSSLVLLTGCGKAPDAPVAAAPAPLPASPVGVATGCIPVSTTTMIPFTANGMTFGSSAVKAGAIPYQQAYGQVILGGAAYAPTTGSSQFRGQRVDGTSISMTVSSATGAAYPTTGYPTTYPAYGMGNVNATGAIQLSTQIQQMLVQIGMSMGSSGYVGPAFAMPGQTPYPQVGTGTDVCVSGIALDLQHTISSQWLYLGNIYFYINGQQHGMTLDF